MVNDQMVNNLIFDILKKTEKMQVTLAYIVKKQYLCSVKGNERKIYGNLCINNQ